MAPLVALTLGALASVVVAHGLSSCGTQALECRHQYLWPTGLDALWHVRSSWTRDWTHVSCIGRRILNHWTTREVPEPLKVWNFLWLLPEERSEI